MKLWKMIGDALGRDAKLGGQLDIHISWGTGEYNLAFGYGRSFTHSAPQLGHTRPPSHSVKTVRRLTRTVAEFMPPSFRNPQIAEWPAT